MELMSKQKNNVLNYKSFELLYKFFILNLYCFVLGYNFVYFDFQK